MAAKVDIEGKGVTNQSVKDFVTTLSENDLNEKEIVAAFRQLDIDKRGKISGEAFLDQIKKVFRAVAAEQGVSISSLQQTQNLKNESIVINEEKTKQMNYV